jgi:hypothetical protein
VKVELCPQCGSGKISRTTPLGDIIKCDGCGWAGKESSVMVTRVDATSLEVALAVAQRFLVALTAEASLPVGRAMFHAGLIQRDTDSTFVGRLVKAAIVAAHRATLEEVDKIQKEITDGDNKS